MGRSFICASMLSSGIYRKHSTAQSALRKAAKQVRADQSATTQTSRQSWGEPRASMSSSTYTARSVLKTNEEIKICPAYQIQNHSQNRFSWCDARRICLDFAISIKYTRPGCFPEHGALGICKSLVCTISWTSLSAPFAFLFYSSL